MDTCLRRYDEESGVFYHNILDEAEQRSGNEIQRSGSIVFVILS